MRYSSFAHAEFGLPGIIFKIDIRLLYHLERKLAMRIALTALIAIQAALYLNKTLVKVTLRNTVSFMDT